MGLKLSECKNANDCFPPKIITCTCNKMYDNSVSVLAVIVAPQSAGIDLKLNSYFYIGGPGMLKIHTVIKVCVWHKQRLYLIFLRQELFAAALCRWQPGELSPPVVSPANEQR